MSASVADRRWSPGQHPFEVRRRAGNFEYRIREEGGIAILMQQNRCTGMIERHQDCADAEEAYSLAADWITSAAIAGGPW